jgi:hypothetical protein
MRSILLFIGSGLKRSKENGMVGEKEKNKVSV